MNCDQNFFFERLAQWRNWIEKSLASSREALENARTKPEGARFDGNLYMSDDGRVWTCRGRKVWYEMVREGEEPFSQYQAIERFKEASSRLSGGSVVSVEGKDGTKLNFIKWSSDHKDEDWGWEVRRPSSMRGQSYSTADYLRHGIERKEAGVQLAKVLFARRKEIEAWLKLYAESQGELRYDYRMADRDWDALLEKFAPGLKGVSVPDCGGLLCSLHMVLDELALGEQVHSYMY
ncbi:MAG: hypothetical protein GF349_05015 [Candidatus Magasanikbacteria bacterium]|nr:hypothetical protein [Candidatus Magasanikbacteria bacterium]